MRQRSLLFRARDVRACGLLIFLAVICALAPVGLATDADVMLDLLANYSSVSPGIVGWTAATVQSYCSWTGITCDTNGRITQIYLGVDHQVQLTIPDSIIYLDQLTSFFAKYQRVTGDVPPAMFQMPNLAEIKFYMTGVNIKWPQTFSPSLRVLTLDRVNISAPLPEGLNYDTIQEFWVSGARVQCPLPVSAFNFLQNPSCQCDLMENELSIIDEIPLENFRCAIATRIQAPIDYSGTGTGTTPPLPAPLFVYQYDRLHVEVTENRIMFFAARNVSGELQPWRDEYAVFTQQDLFVELKNNSFQNWIVGPFASNRIWATQNELRINATVMGGVFELQWLFLFGIEASNLNLNGASVKFSIIVTRIKEYTYPSNALRAALPISTTYRMAHSAPVGSSIKCASSGTKCSSAVMNVTKTITPSPSGSVYTDVFTGSMIEIAFSYAIVGSLDGVPVDVDTVRIGYNNYYHPIGSDNYIDVNQAVAPDRNFPAGPLKDQFTTFMLYFKANPWNNTMVYDPDISIQLLFDSGAASPDEQAGIAAGIGVAAIVAIVVVVVVVILAVSVTAIKVVIWPRINRVAPPIPLSDNDLDAVDQNNGVPRSTGGAWKAGEASAAPMRNSL